MTTIDAVLKAALALSDGDREHLALQLLDSLDARPDADCEAAWDEEISRRLAGIDAGAAQLIPLAEAITRLRALFPD